MTELQRIKIAVKTLISLGIAKNQEGVGLLMGYRSKSSFSQVLNGIVPLPHDFIDRLCKLDSTIVKHWVKTGEGNILENSEKSKQVYIDPKDNPDHVNENINHTYTIGIPLIPIEAMAGFGSGDVQIMGYEIEKFTIPTFKGADYLITIRGNSMAPKYNSGDIVACKHLPLDTFFQWNRVYVLDTVQGALIKRICKGKDSDHLEIVSDNEAFSPFDLHRSHIRSIAIVIGSISIE